MTIRFNCPNCGELIAFADKHCGKRARCTTCRQRFIIPSKDDETPKKVKPPQEKGEPLAGFYRAVFVDSWKLFVRPHNATGLVFVAAAVCFKFFTGHTDYSWTFGNFRFQAPTGLVITLAAWGCLFWYYMEIIRSTAMDAEELPDVYMGGLFGFIWNVIKSLSTFALALAVVLLPCIIYISISRETGVVSKILSLAGLFVFPAAVLTFAVGRDIEMALRPDYILRPIARAFLPYLTTAALLLLAWQLQMFTTGYGELLGKGRLVVSLHLLANLGVQAVAIIAMRSIGLFYNHYSCNFPW
jgi:hypothetical protein